MTSAAKQIMFEGVKVSNNDNDGYIMDPTLNSFVSARYALLFGVQDMMAIESNRKRNAVETALRIRAHNHDRVAKAENLRLNKHNNNVMHNYCSGAVGVDKIFFQSTDQY
ncbi:hypothetical protein ACHAWU_003781 [Discostella pseudostelligera]|uniref:Uncharacterized protein n=1 Tax=Discostella pseudostelligera TaxID=259834 RepID=A0ABD3MPZ2_9STRA